jgi:hypothetical protein
MIAYRAYLLISQSEWKFRPPAGCWWLTPVILATWKAKIWRNEIQDQTEQIVWETFISKITRAKCPGGVAQVIKYLLCKHKVLSSDTSTPFPQKYPDPRCAWGGGALRHQWPLCIHWPLYKNFGLLLQLFGYLQMISSRKRTCRFTIHETITLCPEDQGAYQKVIGFLFYRSFHSVYTFFSFSSIICLCSFSTFSSLCKLHFPSCLGTLFSELFGPLPCELQFLKSKIKYFYYFWADQRCPIYL